MTDRLPIILHAAQDAAADLGDPILSMSLAMTVTFAEVVPLLPCTEDDDDHARNAVRLIMGDGGERTVMSARIAGAVASTAANLRAIGDPAYDEIVVHLWVAATKLMGRHALPRLSVVT